MQDARPVDISSTQMTAAIHFVVTCEAVGIGDSVWHVSASWEGIGSHMSSLEHDRGIRQPIVAGQFYPRQPDALRASIERAFCASLGPGAVPTVQAGPRRLAGIVVPHAGYPYSAACAAWSYAAVARDGRPQAAILLGVNHRGIGAPIALSPAAGWATPLGIAPVDTELAAQLQELDPTLLSDARAHAAEHSLEVQLPFLQFLFGELPILPISIGLAADAEVMRLGQALAALAAQHDILLIASTDFSHYLTQSEAETLDRLALQCIAEVDAEGLLRIVRERKITMCGVLPVAATLTAADILGVQTGTLLHYQTSGDVTGDRQEVVGYGAAALYRE